MTEHYTREDFYKVARGAIECFHEGVVLAGVKVYGAPMFVYCVNPVNEVLGIEEPDDTVHTYGIFHSE